MEYHQKYQHYIRLISKKPLNKKLTKLWFSTVLETAPNGVTFCIQDVDPNGEPKIVRLIHKKLSKGYHLYDIPLTRSLEDIEISKIGESWEEKYSSDSWEIESSISDYINLEQNNDGQEIYLRKSDYDNLCEQMAKFEHSNWMKKKCDDGWSYGNKVNRKLKTHPLLLPWEQLPEKYKNIDYSLPKRFVKFFNHQGYQLVNRGNLLTIKK